MSALVLLAPALLRAEKSGVRPNVIDLPKGPGSISGLGEQFEPELNTGSASYEVKLEVPAGTAGFAPALALSYDSGRGNGPLGLGWNLEAGSIQRQTDKGLPRYGAEDRFLYNGREIVPIGGGVYRSKIEGAFIRFRESGGRWEADGRDGTIYRFGISPQARIDGPSGTFRWALEQMIDVSGNRIQFSYERDKEQLYLARIEYNLRAGAADCRIELAYGPRADALSDHRAGFAITTARRLERIRMLSEGELVRRYELAYDPQSTLSRLVRVTLYGADDTTSLPSVSFAYTTFEPGAPDVQQITNAPAFSLGDSNTELVDFDGDSLPDLLHTQVGDHRVAYNRGDSWAAAASIAASPAVQLATNGVEMADLDGDGRADLVAKLSASDFRYFPNRGTGVWGTAVSFTNQPPFSFEDATVRLLDFDGDGLVDVAQTTTSAFHYWRNRGDGTWAAPMTGAAIPGVLFSDSKVKLGDVDGDRLVDIVLLLEGTFTYWPNLGYGRWGTAAALAGAPDAGPDQARLQLADLDGDGLLDLFLAAGTQLEMWLQQGDGSFAPGLVVTDLPSADPITTIVRAADMNGSGSVDVVWNTPAGSTPWQYLDVTGGVRPHLLRRIDNGLGRVIEISYSSSGRMCQAAGAALDPWTMRLPVATQVVASWTVGDGRGWRSIRRYEYRDGFYDGATRQFRGFGRTVRHELGDDQDAGALTTFDFDLGQADEALKGSLLASELRAEDGTVLRRERNGYTAHLYALGTDGRRVTGADRLWHEIEHVEATDAPVTIREEFVYDDFGNILVRSEWGIVQGTDSLAGADERITTTDYANDTDRWLLGRAFRVIVTNAAGELVSETRTYYDGEPFAGLPLGQLGGRGLPTRVEVWVEGERYAATSRRERDEYGLVRVELDALGARHEIEYDETHRFVTAERWLREDDRAILFAGSYDVVLGVLRTYRDPNGAETRFDYDALARLTAIVRPGDSDALPTLAFEYEHGAPLSRVVTRSRIETGEHEVLERHAWYDGLGRRLALVEDAEDAKTIVTGVSLFGAQGRTIREYEPFFAQGYDLTAPPAGTSFDAHFYDAAGRQVQTVLRDGSRAQTRYRPLVVERWDAEDLDPSSAHRGTPRSERSNALGVVEVQELLGAERVVWSFERDASGRVVRLADPRGNVATYRFDGRDRVVERVHPDAGRAQMVYDDAGNLVLQVDARGARVEITYDILSRPRAERLLDPLGGEEEVVRYHYDDPSPLFSGDAAMGELAWVEDGAGEEHYRRDERGRTVETVRKVDGRVYRLRYGYDDLDRRVRVDYPSGRALDYRYNPRGLLEAVPGALRSLTYSERGLLLRYEYASGAASESTYDELDRLTSATTTAGGRTLQALSYRYDRVGNIVEIEDVLRQGGLLGAGRRYVYDDLYRVVSAEAPARSWSYAFDLAGNIASKSDVGAYEHSQGNRATVAGGRRYDYDAAGNVIARPGWQQTYDAKGRLRTVAGDDGTLVRYRYGYDGRRIVKESDGPHGRRRTVYVERIAEDRDGELVDYAVVGEKRLARLGGLRPQVLRASLSGMSGILSAAALLLFLAATVMRAARVGAGRSRALTALASIAAFVAASCGPCPSLGEIRSYYHFDHLGGLALATDAEGAVAVEVAYDPFGAQLVGSSEPYSFTGKEYEADTGLYDFGARVYDPVLGRWLTPDPLFLENPAKAIERPLELNLYSYALNNPVNYTDPTGLFFNSRGQELAGPANPDPAALQFETRNDWVQWKDVPIESSTVQADDLLGIKGALKGGITLAGMAGKAGVSGIRAGIQALAARGAKETIETAGQRAIGFATGTGAAAFTAQRLQHASRHLIEAGLLPNWSKTTGQKFTELGTTILENPTATFDHVLRGGEAVKGFLGSVGDKSVAFMVFKEGPYAGQVATAVVPNAEQLAKWTAR